MRIVSKYTLLIIESNSLQSINYHIKKYERMGYKRAEPIEVKDRRNIIFRVELEKYSE